MTSTNLSLVAVGLAALLLVAGTAAAIPSQEADQAEQYAEADEMSVRRELLVEAMDVLNDREKDILTQRRLTEPSVTLEDLSGVYNVSRERIRQIEVRAFEKLQKRMQELAEERGLAETA